VTQEVKQAHVLTARAVPTGKESKPVAFKKIILKIPRSKQIGSVGIGIFCVEHTKRRARSGRHRLNEELFSDVFREELENHNYTVVGNPDALFEDRSLDKAKYFVAGLVKDIEANNCYPMAGFGDWSTSSASAYMKVNWQVYETLSRKVVYTVSTEGSAKQEEMIDEAMEVVLTDAFAMATQNLLADEKFHELLAGDPAARNKTYSSKIEITNPIINASEKFDPVTVRPGVVTVRTATGHGSGFFISRDGFLLTNQHVVGEADTVRIVLHSGRHVAGEVLRTDSIRDVALEKVGERGMSPMSLSFQEPEIGSEVLVYGTPMFERLEGTLTKGIVSAYRVEEDKRFIQSD
ncbi:MAG: serine protease, partial [Magnetovibrio sp.]|nr:serine protease [Magnetovibrio sp.]